MYIYCVHNMHTNILSNYSSATSTSAGVGISEVPSGAVTSTTLLTNGNTNGNGEVKVCDGRS